MKIVIDAHIPFIRGVLEPWAEVEYIPGREISPEPLKNADLLIIRSRTWVNRQLLEDSHVKTVISATIGTDHIDTEWCRAKGIRVKNAPGCNSGAVMQYVTAALVWLARRKGFRYGEKTLGIIGVGNVGSKVANTAKALGFRVLLNDPPRARNEGGKGFVAIEDILERSDIMTIHVPLNKTGRDKTLSMINERVLKMAKKGMILINTSRGPVVEDHALKNWVNSGNSGGLVLDVWNSEPDIDRELLEMCDLGTPHIAGYSVDGKANATAMSVQAVAQVLNLPLTKWYPEHLPEPDNLRISLDNQKMDHQECIEKAVLHTYPIERDDDLLRTKTEEFESLRINYPVRREFHNYELQLTVKDDILERNLKKIGFNVIN